MAPAASGGLFEARLSERRGGRLSAAHHLSRDGDATSRRDRRSVPLRPRAHRFRSAPVRRRHAPPRVREARRAPHHASARRPACTSRCGRPNADRVSVSATSTAWDGRVHPMRLLAPAGDLGDVHSRSRRTARSTSSRSARRPATLLKKTDPFGVAFEVPPQSASIVRDISRLPVAATRRGWPTRRDARRAGSIGRCRSTKCTSARGRACPRRATGS